MARVFWNNLNGSRRGLDQFLLIVPARPADGPAQKRGLLVDILRQALTCGPLTAARDRHLAARFNHW